MRCLKAITSLDYPVDCFEVVVVNDGGEISNETELKQLRNHLNFNLLTQPHAGPATARNYGASMAKGEYLAFTDDDCRPDSNWLQSLAARFEKIPDCIVGGRTINGYLENLYSSTSQLLIDYLCSYYNSNNDQAHFITSNNLAMPTNIFLTHGGFDQTFPIAAAEDREFCDRLLNSGHRVQFAPEVVVRHSHALTFRSFCRQHFNYGVGGYRFHTIRAQRNEKPIKVEPFHFYLDLLSFPFSSDVKSKKTSLSALLFASQAANAIGFFWEKCFGTANGSGHLLKENESID
jgi:GT2 family glycosyltransferase